MLQTHAAALTLPPFLADDDLPEPPDAGDAFYRLLMRGRDPDAAELFDSHVVASILTLAHWESLAERIPLCETTGLAPSDLADTIERLFPASAYLFARLGTTMAGIGADEACLRDLLGQCRTDGSAFQSRLAAMLARRAQRPDHLWQDLGLRHRGELSQLMTRHFRPLALRNTRDMKWKKFLYRMICRDAGYALCTAPSCAECGDFQVCFGDESGESRLAQVRRAGERAPVMG